MNFKRGPEVLILSSPGEGQQGKKFNPNSTRLLKASQHMQELLTAYWLDA